jgi:hypothetical protein
MGGGKSVFKEASNHLKKAGFNRNQITTRIVTGVSSRAMAIMAVESFI